jgi:DNA-binding XRE family transcriptional regulator
MRNDSYEMNTAEAFLFYNSRRMAELYPDPDLHEANERTFVTDLAHAVGQYLGELDIALATVWAAHFTISLLDVKGGNPGPVQLSVPVRAPAVYASSQVQATPPKPEPARQAAPEPAAAPAPKIKLTARGLNAGPLYLPGGEIQQHRERLDLTQAELGAKLGLTGTAICTWERGNNWPSARQYIQLRELFGVPVTEAA